jgi:hypothetical protein
MVARLIGVGLLVDRSGGKVDFGVRTEALLHLNVPTYKPAACPLVQRRQTSHQAWQHRQKQSREKIKIT